MGRTDHGSGIAKGAGDMDIVRVQESRRINTRAVAIGAAILGVILVTVVLARLKPAARPVDRSALVIDTVRRGPMTREIRGSGVLTPELVRWITTSVDARVDRVVVQPGTAVTPETVLIELSDAQQQQTSRDAEWQLRAAEADYETTRAQLDSERLDREAAVAQLKSEYEQARLRAAADAELERQGLAAKITRQLSQTTAEELARRLTIEEERLRVSASSQRSQLASRRAQVEQRRAMLDLQQERTRSLVVRAGMTGVLQQVSVQAGQSVPAGTAIARVAQTDRLKAEVRVPETQAKDIAIGQPAKIDTRNGVVSGRVTRVDPAVTSGTVAVDVAIDGALPAGARPDLSIDATIELDRLADVIFVARPVNAQENASGVVFRVDKGGSSATRVPVQYGRASASTIEVRTGLAAGDEVIVSDTSALERHERIQIK
jgi:HlyD family secretion protein